jgi:hypothetical protein
MITQKAQARGSRLQTLSVGLKEPHSAPAAAASCFTEGYIRAHLIAPPRGRKVPHKGGMARLFTAYADLSPALSGTQLLGYFDEA